MSTKTCRDCGETFPATSKYFNHRSVQKDGLNTLCKACSRRRANAFYQAKPEHARDYQRRHRAERREWERNYWSANRQRKAEKDRRYRLAHPEKEIAHRRAYYLANKEKVKAQLRAWHQAHPEYIARHTLKKNMRRRGVPLDRQARNYVDILHNDPCCYCGSTKHPIVIDHIIPVSHGGTSVWDNLTAACPDCNYLKSNKSLLQFVLMGGLT